MHPARVGFAVHQDGSCVDRADVLVAGAVGPRPCRQKTIYTVLTILSGNPRTPTPGVWPRQGEKKRRGSRSAAARLRARFVARPRCHAPKIEMSRAQDKARIEGPAGTGHSLGEKSIEPRKALGSGLANVVPRRRLRACGPGPFGIGSSQVSLGPQIRVVGARIVQARIVQDVVRG